MTSLLAVAALSGTLCFVEKNDASKCQPTDKGVVSVTAAETSRTFVWTAADGKRVIAGIVAANADRVALQDEAFHDVTLALRSTSSNWPRDVRIHLRVPDESNRPLFEWTWTIPAPRVSRLSVIAVPANRYTLEFFGAHHQTARRSLRVDRKTSLREVVLKPLPALTAHVVDARGEPLSGARFVDEREVRTFATSDEQGDVRAELEEPLPETLFVQKAGFGAHLVRLSENDSSLGTIRLSAGRRLTLQIERPEGLDLTASVVQKNPSRWGMIDVAGRSVPARESTAVFADLAPGKYFLKLTGAQPLEQVIAPLEIGDADVTRAISIEPYTLQGSARIGDRVVEAGVVEIHNHEGVSKLLAEVVNGHFGGSSWLKGEFFGALFTDRLHGASAESPSLSRESPSWDIAVRDRFITGSIFDTETKELLRDAGLDLFVRNASGVLSEGIVNVDDDAKYSIGAIANATYEIIAHARDHLDAKVLVEMNERDASAQRDIQLSRGVQTTLEVVTASGAPAVDAEVIEGVSSDGFNPADAWSTDGAGRVTIRSTPDQRRTLFIVPREGSFAVVHLLAGRKDSSDPIHVTVPPAVGELRVTIKGDEQHQFGVLDRFNGDDIPPSVWNALMPMGRPARLPAGMYEVWPVKGQSKIPAGPAKSVGISAGPVEVELTVDRRQ